MGHEAHRILIYPAERDRHHMYGGQEEKSEEGR